MAPDPLGTFTAPVAGWFRRSFAEPTRAQRLGWPPIAAGRHTLILAPTGSGKTLAAFLGAIDGIVRDPEPRGTRVVYVSPAQGAQPRHREEPARAPRRHRTAAPDHRGGAQRRHLPARAHRHAPASARHPHHDPRVALPDPDLGGPRDARLGRDGDRRRDSRDGRHEARHPPGALARAARAPRRPPGAAGRPVGDAAAAGGGGPVPGRVRPRGRHRRCRGQEAA